MERNLLMINSAEPGRGTAAFCQVFSWTEKPGMSTGLEPPTWPSGSEFKADVFPTPPTGLVYLFWVTWSCTRVKRRPLWCNQIREAWSSSRKESTVLFQKAAFYCIRQAIIYTLLRPCCGRCAELWIRWRTWSSAPCPPPWPLCLCNDNTQPSSHL